MAGRNVGRGERVSLKGDGKVVTACAVVGGRGGEWEGGKSGNVNTEHVAMRRKRPPSHPFYKGCPESTVRVTAG